MFYQSEIQHDNMHLKLITNLIAFVLGFSATSETITKFYAYFSFTPELLTISPPSDTFSFILKSLISGAIALLVKVGGDLLINYLKDRKANGKR